MRHMRSVYSHVPFALCTFRRFIWVAMLAAS